MTGSLTGRELAYGSGAYTGATGRPRLLAQVARPGDRGHARCLAERCHRIRRRLQRPAARATEGCRMIVLVAAVLGVNLGVFAALYWQQPRTRRRLRDRLRWYSL